MKFVESLFQSGTITDAALDAQIESPRRIVDVEEFGQTIRNILSEARVRHHASDYVTDQIMVLIREYPNFAKELGLKNNRTTIGNELVIPWLRSQGLATIQGEGNLSEEIASEAESVAKNTNTIGACYRGVKDALIKFGIDLSGGSAWMAADLLANDARFVEIDVSKDKLNQLPRGAIIVWGKSAKKPDGHISISLGNSKEASDHVQNQIINGWKYNGYRVFVVR